MPSIASLFTAVNAALMLALASLAAVAQTYPSQPLRIITPSAPGSTLDVHARKISGRLAQLLGAPVVIENRPGANGIIAFDVLAKSKPDGYTIGMLWGAHAANTALQRKVSYHPTRDFAPITAGVRGVPLLVVHAQLPVKNMAELAAYAKTRPGQLTYGSSGVGSPQHLAMELFEQLTGVHMVHVPYKSSSDVVADLAAGHLQLAVESSTVVLPQIQAGRLRALAVAGGNARNPALPDVPTAIELGMPQFDGSSWYGYAAPAGTPPEIIARLHREITAALRAPDYLEHASLVGVQLMAGSPAEFSKLIEDDIERYTKVVRAAGITAD